MAATMRSAPGVAEARAPRESAGLTGARLDHFEVGELLGTGGMGDVYLARDASLDRSIALKVLQDDRSDALAEVRHARFLREARTQASLNHPNVVHIYYIGHRAAPSPSEQPLLFFAMELVGGDSLEAMIDAGESLDPERARRYMMQVVRGLRAGQQAGIIHRDVKPGNILRTSTDHLKIADFGLAKALEEERQDPGAATANTVPGLSGRSPKHLTHHGAVVGSPWYIAPEQAMGAPVDHRADMYALGATFYHLLSGAPLFDGDTALEVVTAHTNRPAQPLAERMAEEETFISARLAAVVDRLLAKDPVDRFGSYDELLGALEAAAPRAMDYTGFWARAAAGLLDSGIAAAMVALLSWPGVLACLGYVTFGHAWRGQTLGKYLLRMEVVREGDRDEAIGLVRSAARTVVALWFPFVAAGIVALTGGVSELRSIIDQLALTHGLGEIQDTLLLVGTTTGGFLTLLYGGGLALAAFSPRKRALHDMVVRSVVIYRIR